MRILPKSRFVAFAAVLAWAPVGAWAQSATQPPAAAAPAAEPPAAAAPQSPEARVEAYIKQLRGDLHITKAQEAAWKHYTTVMRENARSMSRAFERRARQIESMNAVQNLKSYERLAQAHLARLKRLIPAFERLYNSMTAHQKKLADHLFRTRAEEHIEAHTGVSVRSK